MHRIPVLLLSGLLFLTPFATSAQEKSDEPSVSESTGKDVVVTADKEYNFWTSYRAIHAGLVAMRDQRATLAPNANINFHVVDAGGAAVTGKRVSISLVSNDRELLVTEDAQLPFQFPLDEGLAKQSADVVIAGAGPKPVIRITVSSPDTDTLPGLRMGNARLICAFMTAALKEASTGLDWLNRSIFGKFACNLPFEANPQTHQVFVTHNGKRKDALIAPRNGIFFIPTFISSYSDDARIVARPIAATEAPH